MGLNTIYVLVILKAKVQLQPLPHLPSISIWTSHRHLKLPNLLILPKHSPHFNIPHLSK